MSETLLWTLVEVNFKLFSENVPAGDHNMPALFLLLCIRQTAPCCPLMFVINAPFNSYLYSYAVWDCVCIPSVSVFVQLSRLSKVHRVNQVSPAAPGSVSLETAAVISNLFFTVKKTPMDWHHPLDRTEWWTNPIQFMKALTFVALRGADFPNHRKWLSRPQHFVSLTLF